MNGWEVETLQEALDTCDDEGGDVEKCAALTLHDDAVTEGCILERSVHEEVGPVLEALPGCNPVQPGPENAEKVTGCGATTEIGKPIHYYTDMTESGWAWVGCTQDNIDGVRVLEGASTSGDDLTVESCLQFCGEEGFTMGGVEYANQCFCGDSIADGLSQLPCPWVIASPRVRVTQVKTAEDTDILVSIRSVLPAAPISNIPSHRVKPSYSSSLLLDVYSCSSYLFSPQNLSIGYRPALRSHVNTHSIVLSILKVTVRIYE